MKLTLPILVWFVFFHYTGVYGQPGPLSMSPSDLEAGFKNPPESARPRTWWHWTNSNVTKEGITKDLEWMKRVGIGGMHLADVASGQGQIVEKKIPFHTPEWFDAVRHTAAEADRLGLEMTIFSSAGWSLTGGPWVKPEQAMKKLVWSETEIKGPQNFSGKLPDPPALEGPVRNLSRSGRVTDGDPKFYKDVIVLAWPTPAGEKSLQGIIPEATTGAGRTDPSAFLDDDLNTAVAINAGKDKGPVWLLYSFEQPVKVQAVTMANRAGIPVGSLSVSDNGKNFRKIIVFPGAQLYRSGKVATFSFPETTAKYFRFEFTNAPMRPADVMAETLTRQDTVYSFSEIRLHSGARINRWEDKAGFYHLFSYDPVSSPDVPASSAIDPGKIIDITSSMSGDGTLQWKAPAGSWTIMRFGFSLTGAKNRPATPAGSGYETDKLSREHTEAYIKAYTGPLAKALGPLYGKSLRGVMLDSWEAGMQNWTDRMIGEFTSRRGYDLVPFLPCLAGRIVGNSDVSDRVLWDFRRTLADMFAENHYGVLTEFLNKQGIKTYGEASGVSLEILEDALLSKKYVDYPMGEFWYRALHPELMYYQDIRGAASASHIYDKKIVAAESFTGGGFESPYTLKKIGDYWLSQGVNRFVFHTSAHQPLDSKPGNTMVGTHINRNITWADQAAPFMTYLSRNSFLLQQGKFVADLAYLIDEGAPSTMPIWGSGLIPALPEGYDYDYINADVLVNMMSVADGKLILPGGMKYSVLVLPNSAKMSLPVLSKIHELVRNGATVIGPKPLHTPGYSGFPDSEKTSADFVSGLWGDLDGISRTRRFYGKGMVVWGTPLENVLKLKEVSPDLAYSKPLGSVLNWIHRKDGNHDIYFISNASDESHHFEISFRVAGREPEIWDPADGSIKPSGYKISDNRTIVSLDLGARESVYVVFRNETNVTEMDVTASAYEPLIEISGPWKVSFQENLGAPARITVDTLRSWTLSKDEGVRYFSGTATYSTSFEVSKKLFQENRRYVLDLGTVGDLAEVSLNGSSPVLLWKPPFETDITGLLRKGTNNLEVKVINQWTNRLTGDRLLKENKVLNSSLFVRPVLNESGLLGPVLIRKCN